MCTCVLMCVFFHTISRNKYTKRCLMIKTILQYIACNHIQTGILFIIIWSDSDYLFLEWAVSLVLFGLQISSYIFTGSTWSLQSLTTTLWEKLTLSVIHHWPEDGSTEQQNSFAIIKVIYAGNLLATCKSLSDLY